MRRPGRIISSAMYMRLRTTTPISRPSASKSYSVSTPIRSSAGKAGPRTHIEVLIYERLFLERADGCGLRARDQGHRQDHFRCAHGNLLRRHDAGAKDARAQHET